MKALRCDQLLGMLRSACAAIYVNAGVSHKRLSAAGTMCSGPR